MNPGHVIAANNASTEAVIPPDICMIEAVQHDVMTQRGNSAMPLSTAAGPPQSIGILAHNFAQPYSERMA